VTRKKICTAREGILDDMAAEGVECVDCISVDNALVRLGDPLFAGYCSERRAQCGAGRSLLVHEHLSHLFASQLTASHVPASQPAI
jgi:hypothetical protein